jgi:hypothetical protein
MQSSAVPGLQVSGNGGAFDRSMQHHLMEVSSRKVVLV